MRSHERQDSLFAAALAAGLAFAAPFVAPAYAEMTVMVGGAPMYPSKNIVENAVNSKDHTTLVAAVKAAGLVDTLEGAGPFTVFAPTNEAFASCRRDGRYPAEAGKQGQADRGADLSRRPRPPDRARLDAKIDADGGGKATLKTVQGEELTFERGGRSHLR